MGCYLHILNVLKVYHVHFEVFPYKRLIEEQTLSG